MSEQLMSMIITVVSGVLVGVIVFVAGQILTSVWLSPLQQFKELKKDVVYKLTYYANLYTNVIDIAKFKEDTENSEKHKGYTDTLEEYKSGSDELRRLSCSLKGFAETLPICRIGIPGKKMINEAAEIIMGLSNSFFAPYGKGVDNEQGKENRAKVKEVFKKLKCYCKKD